ncbi:MAG TPA: hypothetical protein VGC22_00635, partial [Chitinophaga sp.]
SIKDIASGALRLRLVGVSTERGRTSERILNAVTIHLADLKKGSTILELECETFRETLEGQQGDVFNAAMLDELPDQTPMTLVIESFKEALDYKEDSRQLDKGLLKKLKNFEKIFLSDKESITFNNRGSVPSLVLTPPDFSKIKKLEESIPEPQEVIINGIVDELKYSKSRITIATNEGAITGILGDTINPSEISKFWGKNLTISGRSHFKPDGKLSFIYIDKFYEPSEADKYFSKVTKKETVEQQIQRQHKQLKFNNSLHEIVGKWPDDEDIDDILKSLD